MIFLAAAAFTLESLIPILIALVVLGIIVYAISLILGMIQVDPHIKQIVWLIVFVIILIAILRIFGLA